MQKVRQYVSQMHSYLNVDRVPTESFFSFVHISNIFSQFYTSLHLQLFALVNSASRLIVQTWLDGRGWHWAAEAGRTDVLEAL